MPIARGIMQIGRVNVYPTSASFISISPVDVASCGDIITLSVKIINTKVPSIKPYGSVSVIDTFDGYVVGTATLDIDGYAIIATSIPNGYLELAVKYDGYINHFQPSQSAGSIYIINPLDSVTEIASPAADGYYCPDQDLIIESFTHLSGNPGIYPTQGVISFALYTNNTNRIELGSATVDSTGHATGLIPAFTTGLPTAPSDGYWLQASFDGYGCFQSSGSPVGTAGLKIRPIHNDTTTTAISVSATPLCYQDITSATVTITGTNLANPSSGTITISDKDSGTILGTGIPVNGVAVIELDGYALPAQAAIDYPYIYTIWADYVPDGYCYTSSVYHGDVGNQLTIKKYFASLGTPTQAGGQTPDRLHTLDFDFEDIITGTAANGLDGYFEFKLYETGTPDILILRFGGQTVSTAGATPETVIGTIPGSTMTGTATYYVVGEYTPSGSKCYDTTIVTSAHSVTLIPA